MALTRGGYHGDTLGAMSVSDPATGRHEAFAMISAALLCRAAAPLARTLTKRQSKISRTALGSDDDVAALILEPLVQGAGACTFTTPAIYNKHVNCAARATCGRPTHLRRDRDGVRA